MHPALLPPLVIPKRPSREPVLLGYHRQRPEQTVSCYRPSYQYLANKPLPQPRRESRLDDFDDIDVFNFYNPCLLPPSPIRPLPARINTDPGAVELPAYALDPPPYPGHSLRRSTCTVSRRNHSYRRRSDYTTAAPPPRTRSPSPTRPSPESPRPLSPLLVQAPQPRRVSLPQWDACSSIYSVAGGDEYSLYTNDEGEGSPVQETPEEYITPYLEVRPGSGYQASQEGYQKREQAALKDLWGVIDGLLGPGASRLGDYDAKSIPSSMGEFGNAVGGWNGSTERGSREDDQRVCKGQQDAAWWQSFRQGLLLS